MNRAGRAPLGLTALAVLILVAVVAVASSGSTPAGSDDTRPPSDVVFDTIVSLGLVLLIPAIAIVVYGLTQRKAISREIATRRYRRIAFPAFIAFILLFTAVLSFGMSRYRSRPTVDEIGEPGFPDPGAEPGSPTGDSVTSRDPEFAWLPVSIILALIAIGAGAYVLAVRRRSLAEFPADEEIVEHVIGALELSLDDLRAEPDARRAVIAAYARLELALAASGLPRWEQETAEEYVTRIFDRLEVRSRPVRTLTDLFSLAKFSQHEVTEPMRQQAIEALEEIRDELKEMARWRAEEQARALAMYERAAAP